MCSSDLVGRLEFERVLADEIEFRRLVGFGREMEGFGQQAGFGLVADGVIGEPVERVTERSGAATPGSGHDEHGRSVTARGRLTDPGRETGGRGAKFARRPPEGRAS